MQLLVLAAATSADEVLPALALLDHHTVDVAAPGPVDDPLPIGPGVDVVLIDGRRSPDDACRLAAGVITVRPTMVVVGPRTVRHVGEGCAVVQLVLSDAGPAEVDARLRLTASRDGAAVGDVDTARVRGESLLSVGTLTVDVREYRADVDGRPLELTRREFDLLAELAAHAGRTLTRRHLLWRVWGPEYEGGARTVDVHVRQLRAALGPAGATMIRTVRGSGYLLVPDAAAARAPAG